MMRPRFILAKSVALNFVAPKRRTILDIDGNVIFNAKCGATGCWADPLQHLMPLGSATVQLMHEKNRNRVATFGKFCFQNKVAMQENPAGSTILPVA